MRLAKTYSKGRIISMLEGGYSLEGLGLSAHEHLRALSKKKRFPLLINQGVQRSP
jgi:acetoin utilization deacetylase AcuC-like enzyme